MKKILVALCALGLALAFALPAFAAPPLLVDDAMLLSASEAAELEERLQALSDKWQLDIVIAAVDSIGRETPGDFAERFFDGNGYGRGDDYSGLMLLVSMEERDWDVSAFGRDGKAAITLAGTAFIGEKVKSGGLSDDEYARAFAVFADWCGIFFEKAATGKPYDKGNLPKTSADVGALVILTFCGGLVIAWIVTGSMKKKLKSVQKKQAAADYLRPGSLQVAYANEQFLYKNVTRVKRETSSGSGGTSSHSSSRSHGTSGKF